MAACRAIHHRWSLRALVAAYIDLALAYLFLCAASLAFLASKLLAFVGLPLPCSCDMPQQQQQQQHGLGCLQGFLLDYPAAKIGGVFDFICGNDGRASRIGNCYDVQLVGDSVDDSGGGAAACGLLEMGRGEEESCGSASQPHPPHDPKILSLLGPAQVDGGESGSCRDRDSVDVKGKALFRQGLPPAVLKRRRRHRDCLTIRGKSSPASPFPPLLLDWKWELPTATALNVSGHLPQAESSAHLISGADHHLSGDENALVEEASAANGCEKALSDGIDKVCVEEKNESDIIRELKKALEEQLSARVAIYLELEKERSAAASAADEAMAMILRLQEEKAAIKMEATQYQRMVEEKSTYDEEEMEILKDVIVQREREKHVLEKEVEAYQQMMLVGDGTDQTPGSDLPDAAELIGQNNSALFGSFDDPELMLKEVYESIKKKERINDEMQCVDESEPLIAYGQNSSTEFVKGSPSLDMAEDLRCAISGDPNQCNSMEKQHPGMADDGNDCNAQEKGMVTMENCPSSVQSHRSSYANESSSLRLVGSQQNDFHNSSSHLIDKGDSTQDRKVENGVPSDDLCMRCDLNADKASPNSSQFHTEASVLDVHIIDDKVELGGEGNTKQVNLPQMGCDLSRSHKYGMSSEPSSAGRVDHSTENSDRSLKQIELNMRRSSSEVTKVGQSMDGSNNRASWLDLRRRSMPAIDNERFKLENEVELLRKRLKVIRQGREKLTFSVEQREKETYNLQRLEEIANQLQEIRNATESGKSMYSASLPPSSKGKFV